MEKQKKKGTKQITAVETSTQIRTTISLIGTARISILFRVRRLIIMEKFQNSSDMEETIKWGISSMYLMMDT